MRFAPSFPLSLLAVSLLSHAAIAQQTNEIERIETTSSRIQGNMNASGYAVSSISEETLSLLSFQHIQESLNYIAGAGVQRGNGQEYLPALRSPVLTGAGACGGILAAEDGIALRAAGFCNICIIWSGLFCRETFLPQDFLSRNLLSRNLSTTES